ncbi:GNAT family N-acetyltransferase [Paraburkholderia sp. J12]|uniref:GNAT family N-acetyltransferase n=1 Tax=Paraburkholderia sp. J12 TaxID=2805432 RepID=UPI002ABD6EA9|nr:GNAT family N-acetyltransferase [Paraburkholderia sp. J12]
MAHVIRIVRWEELSPVQKVGVENLKVSDQQIEYAGPIRRAIEACISDLTGDVQGLAIFNGDEIAGFLVLKRQTANPGWASTGAAVISALRIDLHFQGLGIGTAALQYLPEWFSTHWPDTTSIMLSVDEENEVGRRSYAKAGWVDSGTRDKGRIGWVRYMKRDLQKVTAVSD